MKKTIKVRKMIDQNGLEIDNFTMVQRLKKIIEDLNLKIQQQNQTIMDLKRNTKTTKINEMEVQIQHLNDQNKRLTIIIHELKNKHKQQKLMNSNKTCSMAFQTIDNRSTLNNNVSDFIRSDDEAKKRSIKKSKKSIIPTSPSLLFNVHSTLSFTSSMHKKSYPQVQKEKQQLLKQQLKQKKFQKKYYQLLEETQKLKKELITLKINDPQLTKQRKSLNSINFSESDPKYNNFLQRNMETLQKITQQKDDLQVENDMLKAKLTNNQQKLHSLSKENQTMKNLLQQLQSQIKRKNLLNSDKSLKINKSSSLFKDLSNSKTIIDHL